ncbi:sulfurtransferase TusA family protein [Alkalihalobacillus alcalophilus]|nr:sulfurtransferase TusA family protein [Alkalihalobacillus alcalophilus]
MDASGLQCPGPIMSVAKAVKEMGKGQILEVIATDSQFIRDLQSWCGKNGHNSLKEKLVEKLVKVYVQRN